MVALLAQWIQRAFLAAKHDLAAADLLRLVVLWYHGGVYVDLDFVPLKPLGGRQTLAPPCCPGWPASRHLPVSLPNLPWRFAPLAVR